MKVDLRKVLILVFTVFLSGYITGGLILVAGYYDQEGIPVKVTPYDSKHIEVPETTCISCHNTQNEVFGRNLREVRKYLEITSRFQYKADTVGADYWQTPCETEKLGTGDCEDKAIWLYSKLIKEGFDNVRLVLGEYRINKPSTHMWVNWYQNGQVYILDPTINDGIWKAKEYSKKYYKPLYSYYKDNKWKH